jgi:hypothetical protein
VQSRAGAARNSDDGEDSASGEDEPKEAMESELAKMRKKLELMEAQLLLKKTPEGMSVVSEMTASTVSVEFEAFAKENIRRFVTDKVFPKWKFIFKAGLLGDIVKSAITNKYITVPPGVSTAWMEDKYRPTVRSALDGCRANAQTIARRRYIGKCKCPLGRNDITQRHLLTTGLLCLLQTT